MESPSSFELGDVAVFGTAEEVAYAAVEIAEFGFVERVIEAEHRRAVPYPDKALARFSADTLGGESGVSNSGCWVSRACN